MDCGGAENYIMNIFRNIDRTKIIFDFIVHDQDKGFFDDEIRELGGNIYYAPELRILGVRSYKKFWNSFFRNNKYKIVHAHMQSTASIYLKTAQQYKIKTICHSHTASYGKGFKAIAKRFLQRNIVKYSDIKLACSNNAGVWLYGKNTDFSIVNNSIDLKKFIFDKNIRNSKRAELNIEDGKFVIGHIGRFDEAKNQSFLIDIFKVYHQKNNNSILLLIGDGKLKISLEKKAEALGLKEKVYFLGVRRDANELYMVMDFFIFPSIYEGLPLTLIEAQVSGLSSLISDTITAEVKISKNLKFESLENAPAVWAEKIITSNLREELEIQINDFDVDKVVEILTDFYKA